MRNEVVDLGQFGEEMFYQNIIIEHNVIHNAHGHGVTVGETNGLKINSNTILQNPDIGTSELVTVPRINISSESKNVLIANNVVPRLDIEETNEVVVNNNLVVQNEYPGEENYVGDLFINALSGGGAELRDFEAVPNGLVEQLGVGSNLSVYGSSEKSVGYISNDAGSGLNLLTHEFNASVLEGAGTRLNSTDVTVVWDFGDGNTSQGNQQTHTYADAGEYVVKAVVTSGDGEKTTLTKNILVESPIALLEDFENPELLREGALQISDDVAFESSDNGGAVRLNGGTLAFNTTPDFFKNSEYTLFVDFKKDAGNEHSSGRLVDFPNTFAVFVEQDSIGVSVTTDQGTFRIRTGELGIRDSEWHKLALTFSGIDGTAILFLDGSEVGRFDGLFGAVQVGSVSHQLKLGDANGNSFDGLVDNLAFLKGQVNETDILKGASVADDLVGSGQGVSDSDEPTDVPIEPPVVDEPVEEPTTEPNVDPQPIDLNEIQGTNKRDQINGSVEGDAIYGNGGKDRIFGGEGNDTIYLGNDNWAMADGEAGNDMLYGGSANDVLFGGEGDDFLDGGAGNDKLLGGDGDDTLQSSAGRDQLYGEAEVTICLGLAMLNTIC